MVPGAYPHYDKTEDAAQRNAWRKRTLTISLSLGGLCTLVFRVLTWGYLSWPNHGTWGVVLQAPLLMSMIYQYQYLGFAWRGKRLPSKVWPMRVIAITMGGMYGMVMIPNDRRWLGQRGRASVSAFAYSNGGIR